MISVVFLVSGNGGTLKFLHEAIKSGVAPSVSIAYVMADRDCGALEYARKEKIPNEVMKYTRTHTGELNELLEKISPDLIVTNIHKILDDQLVVRYRNKLINLHYSLLPAFKGLIGMKTIEEAINIKARFTGGTCHYVDEQVDNGEIIGQFATPLSYPPDIPRIQNTVFRASCLLLLNSILILTGTVSAKPASMLSILENPVYFEPGIAVGQQLLDEQFWGKIS